MSNVHSQKRTSITITIRQFNGVTPYYHICLTFEDSKAQFIKNVQLKHSTTSHMCHMRTKACRSCPKSINDVKHVSNAY